MRACMRACRTQSPTLQTLRSLGHHTTMPPPLTAPRLSSLAASTLSHLLELKRTRDMNLPTSSTLTATITKNMSQLANGIEGLELDESVDDEVLVGLSGQYDRLVGLVEGLGIEVAARREGKQKSKTGRLVDTGEEEEASDDEDANGCAQAERRPFTAAC